VLKITEINGVEIGHATHATEKTGCTVVLCRQGAVAGVDARGSAPGTRETDLLRPTYMIRQIHAVMLTGGSAFGLRTADGAMQYLAENGIGYDARGIVVPIIPAAVIFDLRPGRSTVFPSVEMGYEACRNAGKTFEEGLVGAGRGAAVGKILGLENAMNGGFAGAATELPNGVRVGAVAVVNALGDVIDPSTGQIIAGARDPQTGEFADTLQCFIRGRIGNPAPQQGTNTTLAVVATDAQFTKEEINKIAQMAQNGIARATRPAHTMHDGDVVFALSTGSKSSDVSLVGEVAAQMVSQAILRAVEISNP
jgi:L-aminopeptidase/D-esterase-like protein